MANDNRERKRGRGGAAVGGAAVVLAALYLLGGRGGLGFGNGFGFGSGGGEPAQSVQSGEQQPGQQSSSGAQESEKPPADDGVLTVTVTENGLLYEGAEITPEALKDALLRDYAEGTAVEVRDDHGIKADYDDLIALLESLEIPYEEKT